MHLSGVSLNLVCNWDSAYSSLAFLTQPSKIQYCQKWKHNLKTHSFGGYWGKFEAILASWQQDEWLWWLDTDAKITNQEVDVRGFCDRDIVITTDCNGLNAGSMLIHCVDSVKQIFEAGLARQKTYTWDNNWHDQNALAYLLWTISDQVKIIPQKTINSYPEIWTTGDLVLHAPGGTIDEKFAKLRRSK